jgi:hypothetical protein
VPKSVPRMHRKVPPPPMSLLIPLPTLLSRSLRRVQLQRKTRTPHPPSFCWSPILYRSSPSTSLSLPSQLNCPDLWPPSMPSITPKLKSPNTSIPSQLICPNPWPPSRPFVTPKLNSPNAWPPSTTCKPLSTISINVLLST